MPRVFLFILWVVSAVVGRADSPSGAPPRYRGDGFTLQLPREVQADKVTPVYDFDLYKFRYKGDVILQMYVGNSPNVKSSFLDDQNSTKKKGDRYSIRSITTKTIGGLVSREVIFELSGQKEDWPIYFHFWYSETSPVAARVADEIISSTEPVDERQDEKNSEKVEKTKGAKKSKE
jgi:hypothetical protein